MAIKQIHSIRQQMNDFIGGFDDTIKIKPLKDMAKPIADSLQAIEGILYQPKIKAGEDGLRFPVMLFVGKVRGLKGCGSQQ